MYNVTIYTDGAASGNPGQGGYGAVLLCNGQSKELSAGYARTTNNRMELLAVIVALEALTQENCNVQLFTDSEYVVNAIEKGWLFQWERTAFKKKKNPDLWIRFLKVYRRQKVKFNWVKGHSGNRYNERCDQLAVAASKQTNLLKDEGYILSLETKGSDLFDE